jgi:hypothetical protein
VLRIFLVSLASALAALVTIVPASAQTVQTSPPDPTATLQRLLEAFSRGDEATIMSLFTDDAIMINGPCGDEPGQTCVGKAQLQQAVHDSGKVSVSLAEPAVVSGADGNVLTFRTREVFDLPPEARAAGIQAYVERGTATLDASGRFSRIGLVADVTDPQTVALLRIFASMGPEPGAPSGSLVANDGQSLASQPAATQLAFLSRYGDQAPAQWVQQHNAALGH